MKPESPAEEYFVAGPPVGADRPCYVSRPADRHLMQALREGRSCHVFAPRLMGKTSLVLSLVPSLRDGGRHAAMVDLNQMGGREGPGDAGRWFYTFAYRIIRELRLKVSLQQWWQEHASLTTSQRLVEFFRELVLGQVPGQVVVFIDEMDSVESLGFLPDFLGSLRACLAAAGTDPEFRRLAFVLLGASSPARLAPEPGLGPFELSEAVTLEDFSLAETLELAAGLPLDGARARALLERVHYWTNGQPYLTQKLCRALARGDTAVMKPADVDRLVEQRLLNPAVMAGEPVLAHIAARLQDRERRRAQLLSLYGRVRKGLRVPLESESALQDRLRLLGLVVDDGRGRLRVRNRIYAAAFTTRWVNQHLPLDLRGVGAAAVLALLLIGGPFWYTQLMPRHHVAAMGAPDIDTSTLLTRHRRLSAWPGHAATADRLLAAALERQALLAPELPQVLAAREALVAVVGDLAQGDALPARYWRERLRLLQQAEERDGALLAAMQAATWGDSAAAETAAGLIGEDYPRLLSTLRPTGGIGSWTFTADREVMIASRDATVGAYAYSAQGFTRRREVQASGLLHEVLSRRIRIDRQAPAGIVTVTLQDVAGDPSSWQAQLVGPQQQQWQLEFTAVTDGQGDQQWQARIDADDINRRGEWHLRLAETIPARDQALAGWRLEFGDARGVTDRPELPLVLPRARATQEVSVLLARQARLAVAIPDPMTGTGSIVVWSLATGAPVALLQRPEGLLQSGLAAEGSRLLLRTSETLLIVDAGSGAPVASVALDAAQLESELVLSHDERQLAWLERSAGQLALRVLSLEDGSQMLRRDGLGTPDGRGAVLALGAGGVVAVIAHAGTLRALDLVEDRVLAEAALAEPVVTMSVDPEGDWVALSAADGGMAWYRLPQLGQPRHRLWGGPASQWRDLPLQLDRAGRVAVAMAGGRVQLLRLADGAALSPPLQHGPRPAGVRLSPDGELIASYDDSVLRLWLSETSAPQPRDAQRSTVNLGPDGRDALLGDWNGAVRILPAEELARAGTALTAEGIDYLGHTAPVTAVSMSPDRALVASGSADGVIRLWSTLSGEPLAWFMRHADGAIRALVFSPDGSSLVSLGAAGAHLWAVDTGERLRVFPSAGQPLAAAFVEDGERLVLADASGSLAVWQPEGERPAALLRADAAVSSLVFLPAHRLLASGDQAGRLQLWDLQRGTRAGESVQLGSPIQALVSDPANRVFHAATERWIHRFGVLEGALNHREGHFPTVGLAPATLRVREPGGPPVGLVGYDMPLLLASDQTRPAVPIRDDWATRLGLTLAPNGRFERRIEAAPARSGPADVVADVVALPAAPVQSPASVAESGSRD